MNKNIILVFMLLFVCVKTPSLFAKPDTKKHDSRSKKKRVKIKKGGHCNHLAQQLSFLRLELDALENGSSKENISKLNGWIEQLEEQVASKLNRAETSLEKHSNFLNESDDQEATEENLRKIKSSENKIETCKELLKIIEQLKLQLRQKTQNLR